MTHYQPFGPYYLEIVSEVVAADGAQAVIAYLDCIESEADAWRACDSIDDDFCAVDQTGMPVTIVPSDILQIDIAKSDFADLGQTTLPN